MKELKKPSSVVEFLWGLGISAVSYAFLWLINTRSIPMGVKALVDVVFLSAFTFLIVKAYRIKFNTVATTLLVCIIPVFLFLALAGACGLLFFTFKS